MLPQLTIPKKKTQPVAMDRQQLYAIGLDHVQRLSSQIWSDYNVHDPGITTLELLCYALTELSYRASLPIEDLLASKSDNAEAMKQQFFSARQILPSRPRTVLDYRKLLIDIDGVKNAWLNPAICAGVCAFVRSPQITTNTGFKRFALAMKNSKFAVSCAKSRSLANMPNCGSEPWMKKDCAAIGQAASTKRMYARTD